MRGKLFFLSIAFFVVHHLVQAQIITTIAGTGTNGYSGDGGPATSAKLFDPHGICIDGAGNIYFTDHGNHVVRKITPSGIISTFAGTGTSGYSGDGGPATAAQFMLPYGICADKDNNIYISDQGVSVVRKVSPAGVVSTVAGNGINSVSTGDGGPAIQATLFSVAGIAVDQSGNLYLAEFAGNRIRKVSTSGIITTIAGSGFSGSLGDQGLATQAQLQSPTGVDVDGAGNIYIADMANSRIRKINTAGIITTIAGGVEGNSGDGGPATQARLKFPFSVHVDKSGNVYIGDSGNHAVRKIGTNGVITAIAGNGTAGYSGDGGPATEAQVSSPSDICLDQAGNLLIVGASYVIRKVTNADDCTTGSFLKTYFTESGGSFLYDFVTAPNNDMIAGGYLYNPADADNLSDAVLLKLNSHGVKVWERNFMLSGSQGVEKVVKLRDGNYLAAGYDLFGENAGLFLFKFDGDGNTLWKRTYQYTIGVSFRLTGVQEDQDGSLIATAYYIENGLSFYERILFLKFSSTGSLLFAKSYKPPGQINVTSPEDFIIQNGYSYIAGQYHSFTNLQGALLKVNNATGNLEWVRYYGFNGGDARFSQIFPFGENRFCLIGNNNRNNTDTSVMVICDTLGAVVSTAYLTYPAQREPGKAVMDGAGNLTWINSHYSSLVSAGDFAVARLHPVNGAESVMEYPQLTNWPRPWSLRFGVDSSIFFAGNQVRLNEQFSLFAGRLSSAGTSVCPAVPRPFTFGAGKSVAADVLFSTTDKIFTEIQRNWSEGRAAINFTDTLCFTEIPCSHLELTGPVAVCAGDTLRVKVQKTCVAMPNYIVDDRQLQLVFRSDTLVKFIALRSGPAKVLARIQSGCRLVEDSLVLLINHSPGTLSLGGDKDFCPGNTILLNARMGYTTYRWQDGSTDSTFTVTQPGQYHVTTTDACGGTYSDTILITAAPPIPFSAGPDRTKCNSDTLRLSAPDGFLNYAWSNHYNLSATTGQTVTVNPMVDTAYYVKAEKTPGCFAYDTVRVKVFHSLPINLGVDRSFCLGDSAGFNAGPGFATYLWSNGQTAASVVAKAAGTYSVTASTAEGCKSYDTVTVLQVFGLPRPQLDKNTALCMGESRILNPGTFATYQWSNGTAGSTITVHTTGTYAVTVTDQNGCQGSDTTRITTIHPLPFGFLPPDTAICSYGSLELKPTSEYSRYTWSNGAVVKNITVTQPGLYWLEVTDDRGCRGKDTVLVQPKDCLSGSYVPSAFTPNGDGKNDVFRPLLFGNVKQYRFTVYNRWGEVVYQSTELQKGWNGKVAGVLQDNGVFVWTCTYQLEGDAVKTEKGTVMLLR